MDIKKALKKNIVSNLSLFFLNILIGFWLPRFLVNELGFGAYGMIPLANMIIGYAAVFTVAINGTLSRFLALSIADGDQKEAMVTFNTAFTSFLILFSFLLPLMLVFSQHLSSFISVPDNILNQAIFLFSVLSIAFTATAFSSLFNSSAYVANRLDLINRVNILNTFTKIVLILSIFLFVGVSLYGYAIAVLIGVIVATLYSFSLFKKFTPDIQIKPSYFNIKVFQKLFQMGGWLVVIQVGGILFNHIDLLLVNKFFGNEQGGKYGVVLQIALIIRVLASTLSGAAGPLVLKLFANKEYEKIVSITKLSNKSLSLFIACIVGTVLVLGESFLSLWINKEFITMSTLLFLLILPLPLNLGAMPLFSINRAYNKVKWPGIFTFSMGLLNFSLAYIFIQYTSMGVYGIALASAIVLTMKNVLFIPIYTAKTMGKAFSTFLLSPVFSLIILLLAFVIKYGLENYININSWIEFVLYSALIFGTLGVFSLLLFTNKERKAIRSLILRKKI
jgi:O-antigen/teichoic acid export membrane protein